MPLQDLLNQAVEVRPGDHLVALYAEEKEIEDYVTSFIHSALLRNERCLYITGDVDSSAVLQRVERLSAGSGASGELLVLEKSDVYSKGGKFSPDKLISLIQSTVETAVREGYSGLAITGEISWVLDYEDGEDLIIEYEWKLNEYVFDRYPVSALCRYNVNRFSHEMIRNIIQLHPLILWRSRIHENPYYIPPEGFKNNAIAQYQVDTWLKNIFSFTNTKSRFQSIVDRKQEEMRLLHKNMTNGIIMAFLKLLETHDPYTKDHCSNVASLAFRLAESLEISEEFSTKIHYASLVHDIGKTIVPHGILNKPGNLTGEEYGYIKMHPEHGANALDQMDQVREIAQAVRHHHERYDGRGYPDGLSGDEIPLMSRIIAICDSYDAITNDRPYRKAQSRDCALGEIAACAGTQFDPGLAAQFIRLFSPEEKSGTFCSGL
ncbi:putative nucleotidyltransferase with HDIG domain [Aminivibrio pyruvatiphilus]|jgi:putative nucleotidyltransferase with HDIG domain|uniref:Putative nucleotidyltransferase with HDIG domain n=2 Tax=Aminivibrio pyruvatiphilus TaxID=1005740 RepID=A0A4R8M800_9BACT|nr:HD domain-containing phosphohydrolase [Aminivibrio sp.]MEA4952849.1 MEDS domain-containing protein [Aminivibrio sp.]NCB15230.1 HD domain-containing protein [Synergistales bacterium]TDY61284.1 putative nucleotidyltransferase with HDIG domain [Aminivibrio pyruvatiphilus]HPF84256.1 MEDS domain-containing protein [Aminivibrio sp.]